MASGCVGDDIGTGNRHVSLPSLNQTADVRNALNEAYSFLLIALFYEGIHFVLPGS